MVKTKRTVNLVLKGKSTKSRPKQGGARTSKKYKDVQPIRMSNPSNPTFSDVSTISTAPVAIGNSMKGFKAQAVPLKDGMRVVGRDYGFTPVATGSVTGWACVGGMPLTPCCMPTTIVRNFTQMYNKFKVNSITFHYITSSSTATTGDVVFYSQKSAVSSCINWTSSSFLPFVLSDAENVIGPQWTNHSIRVTPTGGWKLCDYGVNSDQEDNSAGDIFLFSKTSSTESPGYVVMDYDITFRELSYNPRAGSLPTARAQWQPFSFVFTGAVTKGDGLYNATNGTSFIGSTTITKLAMSVNEIYKIVVDVTNSTFVNTTASNFLENKVATTQEPLILTDGFTMYACAATTDVVMLSANMEGGLGNTGQLYCGVTATYAETIRGYAKLVGYCATAQYNV